MEKYTYKYPRAALTTDALVFAKQKERTFVLLVERGFMPFKGYWALPGGFIQMDETLEEACIRELNEETGLRLRKMTQFKAYDQIDRDPRDRTISIVFSAEVDRCMPVKGDDDAVKASWFEIKDLPKLAFDHEKIITEFFEMNSIT